MHSHFAPRQVPSAGHYTGMSPLSELSLTAEEGFNLISPTSPASPAMVTKEQYDKLLSRFQELQAIIESRLLSFTAATTFISHHSRQPRDLP